MPSCEEKVPGGKLVNVSVSRQGVTVSGDFFIFPEEGVFLLEETLCSLKGDEPLDMIEAMLLRTTKKNGITLIGLDEHVIARLYKGALDVASHQS